MGCKKRQQGVAKEKVSSERSFLSRSESHDITNDARLEGFDESEGLEDQSSDVSTKQSARNTPNTRESQRHVTSVDTINSEAFTSDSEGLLSRYHNRERPASNEGKINEFQGRCKGQ